MQVETKRCPYCIEEINVAAKKCKYCHTLLTSPTWLALRTLIPTFLIGLAIPLYLLYSFRRDTYQEDFGKHRTELVITNSSLTFSKGEEITLVGTIKNTGALTWSPVVFEVQYFNQTGQMIDAYNDRAYEITLTANSEQAFRLNHRANKPQSEYSSHRVTIRDAEEATRFRK